MYALKVDCLLSYGETARWHQRGALQRWAFNTLTRARLIAEYSGLKELEMYYIIHENTEDCATGVNFAIYAFLVHCQNSKCCQFSSFANIPQLGLL